LENKTTKKSNNTAQTLDITEGKQLENSAAQRLDILPAPSRAFAVVVQ
jgi:hypothetical protein